MTDYLVQHGRTFLIDLFRLCVWLAILTAIFVPLERLFSSRPQKIFRPGIWIDLGYYFLNGLLPAMLMSAPLGVVAWGVYKIIPHGFHETVVGLPFWWRMLAGLVVGDVAYYWAHRCLHGVPLLWRFHAVHHSSKQIDFLVNTRAHPIDMVISRLSGLVPLYVLGLAGPAGLAGSSVPVLIALTGMTWAYFIHANLRWHLGPLSWVLSTPHFHHWHHDVESPANRNYASMLPLLDRLFGTHYSPKGRWPAHYGIPEPIPDSFGEQLIQPFLTRPPSTVA
jgi:sterol desaturase/sphingolipid hydroxylase (fatty acid hydroxylase superfamily)